MGCRRDIKAAVIELFALSYMLVGPAILGGLTVGSSEASAQRPPAAIEKRAFVVGVSKYLKDGLEHLKYGAKDADDFANELESQGFKVTRLIGPEATHAAIRQSFEQFIEIASSKLNRDDIVLVFFAGHGVQKSVKQGEGGEGEVPFFCACDSLVTKPETMVSLNWVMDRLKESGSSNNLLLVDACRNNPDRGGSRSLDGSTIRQLPPKLSVLFGSGPNQKAYESVLPEIQQGVFTHVLLEGLRGAAATEDGEIFWLDLVAYTQRNVPKEVVKLRGKDLEQKPNMIGNLTTPILMGRGERKGSGMAGSGMGRGAWGVARGSAPELFLKEGFSAQERKSASEAWAGYLQVRVTEQAAAAGSQPLQLRLIPPGEFQMGCNAEEVEAVLKWDPSIPREGLTDAPAHRVRLSRPYFLGMYEVTKGQFDEFVRSSGYQTEAESDGQGGYGYKDGKYVQSPEFSWRNPGFEQGPDHPVVNVSWNDAVAYCQWLTEESRRRGELPAGWAYRLPTEAEWEYACRSGSRGWYSFGDDPESLVRHGNVADASYKRSFTNKYRTVSNDDGIVYTAPVGKYTPNRFGLSDMHGNVWEWCGDWYGEYPVGSVSDPSGPAEGSYRVYRGGSWLLEAAYCRSALRGRSNPSNRGLNYGFRVALSSPDIPK